jgi:hypothetical protein
MVVSTVVQDSPVFEARRLKFTSSTASPEPQVCSNPYYYCLFTATKIGNLSVTVWKTQGQRVSLIKRIM